MLFAMKFPDRLCASLARVAGAGAAGAALLFALAGCSPLGAINALVRSDTYRLGEGVAYGALPRQKLDIYTPVTAAPSAGWPVVVFFYGGSWNSGERAQYGFVGAALASRGLLTLVADYRLYPEVRYPDFLLDSAQALAYGFKHAAENGGKGRGTMAMFMDFSRAPRSESHDDFDRGLHARSPNRAHREGGDCWPTIAWNS